MSRLGLGAFLLAVWLLLWGSVSVANVASGVLVAVVALWITPARITAPLRLRIRPWRVLVFLGAVVVELARANWIVGRELVTPGSNVRAGVLAVELPPCSAGMVTIVANVLSLAPGTVPIEVTRDPEVVHVHVLHMGQADDVRRSALKLSRLALHAFGSAEAVASLDDTRVRASGLPEEGQP